MAINTESNEVYKYWGYYYVSLGIAAEWHQGQVDKAGAPYILHPRRVAEAILNDVDFDYLNDEEKIFILKCASVAALHDVLEDTACTEMYLRQEKEIPEDIVEGVKSVTRLEGESYGDFVKRAAKNRFGRIVKRYDLEDNLDVKRLKEITEKDVARINKYLKWYHYLSNL